MTNPDNAVGTNGAFGGRTSVNAFNDVLSSYASRGVISGWGIVPSSGMTLSIGGDGVDRDVAIAADATNNKTTVNNISGVPIEVTLDSAPASNSRYDAIVVYVDKPPISSATQDNPECCGIIPVSGLAASSPAYPDDATIRSAITADGASGATAYYAILGYVLVAAETTAITSAMITTVSAPSLNATVDGSNLVDNSVTSDKIDWATHNFQVFQEVAIGSYIDGNGTSHTLYRKYYMWGNQNIAQDGFINHAVALSDTTILSTNWILYRSDVAGLITAQGPNLYPVFTSGGADLRLYTSGIPAQSGASIMGWIEYYR